MSHPRSLLLASLVAAVLGLQATPAAAGGHTLSNSRLSITFGNDDLYPSANDDRVDAIAWKDSTGTLRTDYVANGGPLHCGDPEESFGQSFGAPEGSVRPTMVVAGVTARWTGTGARKGSTTTSATEGCGVTTDALTRTTYSLVTGNLQVNQLQVVRTFQFNARTPLSSGHGLRAYVPRLSLERYTTVLYPAADGTVQSRPARECPYDCEITDWNGRWLADDDGQGNGMVIIRDPSSTAPAYITVNWDLFSWSNLSSIVLTQPEGGWTSKVVETEYLCFYDATTWTPARRSAGLLPKGCGYTVP